LTNRTLKKPKRKSPLERLRRPPEGLLRPRRTPFRAPPFLASRNRPKDKKPSFLGAEVTLKQAHKEVINTTLGAFSTHRIIILNPSFP